MLKKNLAQKLIIASAALAPAGGFVLLASTFIENENLSQIGFAIMLSGYAAMLLASLVNPILKEEVS